MAKKHFIDEENDTIKFYENLSKLHKQKLFKVDANGKTEFSGSSSDLKDLLDIDIKLMTFKRKRVGLPI